MISCFIVYYLETSSHLETFFFCFGFGWFQLFQLFQFQELRHLESLLGLGFGFGFSYVSRVNVIQFHVILHQQDVVVLFRYVICYGELPMTLQYIQSYMVTF